MTVSENAGISEMVNMVFSGTMVTNGYALCCVVRTGMETEIGKIQQAVMEARDVGIFESNEDVSRKSFLGSSSFSSSLQHASSWR